ncbi:MAG: lipid-A-disaccharide synthase [Candidatus Zixiibacteriota bacterium]
MSDKRSIFISAGDPSADYYGKELLTEIGRVCGKAEFFGLGGPLMQQAGLRPLADHRELAVLGFWEIVPKFFFFKSLLNKAVREISEAKPKAVILIDYPGFNLRLAERIKHLNIPIVYYISPQVWAWGKKRVFKIKELIDLMLVIFPFEETFYKEHGVTAKFTGHPIVDRFENIPGKAECRERLDFHEMTFALLPGSRVQEVKRMLPAMVDAARRIKEHMPSAEFVIGGVEHVPLEIYHSIIGDALIPIVIGRTPEIMCAADLVIVSSGTATVETAYFATPMIVVYKTGALTYQIARRLITLDSIGMVNIVAGQKVVPEFIQHAVTGENLAREALDIINDKGRLAQMVMDLKMVRDRLGDGDAAARAFLEMNKALDIC